MRIHTPGKVCDHLWFLGREETGIYLLEGTDYSMIISGGTNYIVPDVLEQLIRFSLDEHRISKILILHSHFDHVGVIPFFKRRNPDIEIYASARAWNILQRPSTIETINLFSNATASNMNALDSLSQYDLEWRNDIRGFEVSEGHTIDLGNLTVSILETPGHSSCSISAYVPELKALFPSDGGGIPHKDTIIPAGNSNYTQFQESLNKLKTLEVDYLCADHGGFITDEEARSFIKHSIIAAKQFRSLMERVYKRTKNIDATTKELVDHRYTSDPDYFLPRKILEGVYRQMVKHIAGE